jgi:hypothetical protein
MGAKQHPESPRIFTLQITEAELQTLKDALDSHEYWQLSDPIDRHSGQVTLEDDDPRLSKQMAECRTLLRKLEQIA